MALAPADETDLLLPLHDGVHEQHPWATFLSRLRQRVRADSAAIIVSAGPDAPDVHFAALAGQGGSGDRAWRRQLRPGRVYAIDRDQGFGRIVRVGEVGGASAWLIVRRQERDFTAADGALLTRLAPHLGISLRTRRALDRSRVELALSEQALRRAGVGWVGFDADARLLSMSSGAQAALGPRWLAVGVSSSVAAALQENAVKVMRVRGDMPHWLLLIPCSAEPSTTGSGAAVIGLMAIPRNGDQAARAAALSAIFALPPSEARLAAAIAGGASLSEAAAQLGLTLETARNYSKRLFAKTRTRGQVDLVRLIANSVAALA
ncbi:helix-turn-helix transcriptional regulator [Sphingomonas sp. CCH5-D11]|uniref:helix-turn-helix transcriptional regulator n=1 Tax=Sphingomonas sp. CCH5-D11 TaxID=1768786 RepID=UPI00083169D8|nr:hypothetical protein [Sphingomonas sp. CCH5-D11]